MVGRAGERRRDRPRGARRADGRDRRVSPLPPARRVARAGRTREGRAVPRRDLLGSAGAGVRRPRGADPAPRPRAGRPRRQPDRPRVHRRCLGGLPVRRALTGPGLASSPVSRRADDGLTLSDTYIAAAVRCAPPANKPTVDERDACAPFLVREMRLLSELRVVVALGGFGWDAAIRAFADLGHDARPKPRFGHLAEARVGPSRAAGLVPPIAAEHVHRPLDSGHAGRGCVSGMRDRRVHLTPNRASGRGVTVRAARGPGATRGCSRTCQARRMRRPCAC